MANTQSWDRIATRADDGPEPTDAELRLLGDIRSRRVIDLGCGDGGAAVAFARRGATVIALDASATQLRRARERAERAEVRVEWHHGDVADLAFLRADSIDVAFSAEVLPEVTDLGRLLRQVHRVLHPHGAFVFSYRHPVAACVETGADGVPRVVRSYLDPTPTTAEIRDERLVLHPRTMSDVFTALVRAGYRVDTILEPDPVPTAGARPVLPDIVVWRARKEGV